MSLTHHVSTSLLPGAALRARRLAALASEWGAWLASATTMGLANALLLLALRIAMTIGQRMATCPGCSHTTQR
jgi:hypothetical protein